MFDHPTLAALTAIPETGGFDAAAHRIGVMASAVSQRIPALEERIGGSVQTRSQSPD